MTLDEFFQFVYLWSDTHAFEIFGAAIALPVVGTLAAWIGKGGQTDTDGRLIASVVMAVAIAAVAIELLCLGIAIGVKNQTALDASVLLLIGPVICLVGCVVGIRQVFPLNELGSVKSAFDVGAFVLACLAMKWVFSQFRGWSLVFFGSFGQLIMVALFAAFLLWRLYKRAFGGIARRAT